MNVWLVVLLAGVGSYLFRVSLVMLADRVILPERLERTSAFVAPAAFAALAAGGIAASTIGVEFALALPPLVAVAAAILAVFLTQSAIAAVLAGMPTLWVLSMVLGG